MTAQFQFFQSLPHKKADFVKKSRQNMGYFGNSLETAGTLKKGEHVVMMHGAMWHRVCYQVAEKGQKHLVWESVPQQTDSSTHRLNGSPVRYIDMTYRLSIYRHF